MLEAPVTNNVVALILGNVTSTAPAVIEGSRNVTHQALAQLASAMSQRLRTAGVGPGDVVALVGDNSIEWVAWYLAIIGSGCTVLPLPGRESETVLRAGLRLRNVRAVVAASKYADGMQTLKAPEQVLLTLEDATPSATADASLAWLHPIGDRTTHLAAIMMTSGSTSEPKGVCVSHGNIAANTRSILSYLHLKPSDRMMTVLPLHYCFGLSLLHTHLWVGGSVVLNNLFMFTEKVLDNLEETECTGFAGVPSTYQTLLKRTKLKERKLASLSHVQQAGGRLAVPILTELRASLPAHTKIFTMYGATEATARLAFLPPYAAQDKQGSVGVAIPGVELAILDESGQRAKQGTVGELVARGPNVTLGYYDQPELSRAKFKDGWLHTGDIARIDEDGFCFIEGRREEFLKSYGFRISPREIEDVLLTLPAIHEVVVHGVPDADAGEAVAATIVLAPGAALAEDGIKRYCLEKLPNHKVPSIVRFVSELPKTQSGKVMRARVAGAS